MGPGFTPFFEDGSHSRMIVAQIQNVNFNLAPTVYVYCASRLTSKKSCITICTWYGAYNSGRALAAQTRCPGFDPRTAGLSLFQNVSSEISSFQHEIRHSSHTQDNFHICFCQQTHFWRPAEGRLWTCISTALGRGRYNVCASVQARVLSPGNLTHECM